MIEEKDLKLPDRIKRLIGDTVMKIQVVKHPEIGELYRSAEASNNELLALLTLMHYGRKLLDCSKLCGYKVAKELDIKRIKKEIKRINGAPREIILNGLKRFVKIDDISLQKIHDMMYSSESYDTTVLTLLPEEDGSHTLVIIVIAVE